MEPSDRPLRIDAPAPWEVEESFTDTLRAWLDRTPWLALSGLAHLVALLFLMAIPWHVFQETEGTIIQVARPDLPEDDFVEPLEPEFEPELEPQLPTDEPRLAEPTEAPVDDPDLTPAEGDPIDVLADARDTDFEQWTENLIGIGGGGGGGGHFGERGDGRGKGGAGGHGRDIGLSWLAAHQDEDGKWDADGFMKHDPEGQRCDGAGEATHDVGVTALALLAFLGDGNSTTRGPHRERVARGVRWLLKQQDPDTGRVGEAFSTDSMYDHALATLTLCEAYYFSRSPVLRQAAQSAVNFVLRARNPYGAWRYDVPPIGDNDTSVTGWMVLALTSAKEGGLLVDEAALAGALAWIEEATDPATGRVGYDSAGSRSSRTRANKHYPLDRAEAMTAVGLLCRVFLGQDPREEPMLEKHADLLLRVLPEWDPKGFGCDMYAWYYGSYAMFQMGGRHWKSWDRALAPTLLDNQRREGAAAGSWDPIGPWGYSGGRVYSTALMTLCLEVHYRYARVMSGR